MAHDGLFLGVLMKIVIPGGSGKVGSLLSSAFHEHGHEVVVLSRQPAAAAWRVVSWDGVTLGDWASEIDGADVVINLAGRSVNCRYTAENRRAIIDSRIASTRVVGDAIARASRPPRVWLQSSTATIYAHTFGAPHDERSGRLGGQEADAPASWAFSIEVARGWEKALDLAVTPRTRKVALRSAMIMSTETGGILDTLLVLVRRGLGGPAGDGRQFISWIHQQDFISAIEWLIAHDDIDGIVNVASPNPLPNTDFMRILRHEAGVPFGLPSTKWMLAIGAVFMRTETELILKSRRVIPGRLIDGGFVFRYPRWEEAAHDLVAAWYRARAGTSHAA
jgi:uncharacterized protein (TIGR01777 family)